MKIFVDQPALRDLSKPRNDTNPIDLIFRINYAFRKCDAWSCSHRNFAIPPIKSHPSVRFLKGNEHEVALSTTSQRQKEKRKEMERNEDREDVTRKENGIYRHSSPPRYRENSSSTRSRKMTENGGGEGRERKREMEAKHHDCHHHYFCHHHHHHTTHHQWTARAGSISVSACNLPRRMLMDRTLPLLLSVSTSKTLPLAIDLVIDREPRRPARKSRW